MLTGLVILLAGAGALVAVPGLVIGAAYLTAALFLFRAAHLDRRGRGAEAAALGVRAMDLEYRADRLVRFITNGRCKGA